MFKNILFGLGSAGVVVGGGYMIYNATRSGDEGPTDIKEGGDKSGESGSSEGSAGVVDGGTNGDSGAALGGGGSAGSSAGGGSSSGEDRTTDQ